MKSSMCNGAIKDYCITADIDPTDHDIVMITATEIPAQPIVRATRGEWDAFIAGVKDGDFDDLTASTELAGAAQ